MGKAIDSSRNSKLFTLVSPPPPPPSHRLFRPPPPLSISMSNILISSVRAPTPLVVTTQIPQQFRLFNQPPLPASGQSLPPLGVSFSSDSESDSSGSDEMDDDDDDELDLEPYLMEAEPSNVQDRKRKRGSSSKSSASGKLMEFFEGLMRRRGPKF